MHLQDFFDISQSGDKAAFKRRLIDFAHRMDFPLVNAVLVAQHPDRDTEFFVVSNRPTEFTDGGDKELAKTDPLMSMLRRTGLPVMYDQAFYVKAGAAQLWENAAPYGYRTGISVSLRLSTHLQFVLGLDRERALPRNGDRVTRMLADLQMLAVHSQDAAQRFLVPTTAAPSTPSLSPRELEVLRWTREGKTAWEAGQLMSISEPTVKYHLKNILVKLDATSKHVAVLKAISMGLISA